MHVHDTPRTSVWGKLSRWSAFSSVVLAAGVATVAPGCLDRPIERVEPRTTSTIVERLIQSAVDKIDLLLVIDNSRSMADKQAIMSLAVPDLVNALVNPNCVSATDGTLQPTQPANPTDSCEAGFEREFKPITDIHIGIITSSIGDHGGDVCSEALEPTNNDRAELISRTSEGGTVPTYNNNIGFLAWDPEAKLTPPGEANRDTLINNVRAIVEGAGEVGCGFEASLEAWYRFLVDPNPYQTIEEADGKAVPDGTDTVLLAQRTAFMRPDSLLAIIMLTDENDCSIKDGGQYYFAAKTTSTSGTYHLPKPQSTCATDPNSACCRSCGQPAADGCPAKGAECDGSLDNLADPVNLRCFDQKRRFGIDFLQPISRYLDALTQPEVSDRDGNVVQNPIYSDLDTSDQITSVRDPGLVFIAGIVGVPWQLIARRDGNDVPDLIAGLTAGGEPAGGFMNSDELLSSGTWDAILGDPSNYVPPSNPHMIESIDPRPGIPAPNDGPLPAGWDSATSTAFTGHEYTPPTDRSDLQFACVFPLLPGGELDCAGDPVPTACDCMLNNTTNLPPDKPLCQSTTATSGTTQWNAKAYPGIRELTVLKGASSQGIVGSICPAQLTNQSNKDFGYRPAIQTIVERLKEALGGKCLPRTLTPDENGQVSCIILEATRTGGNCVCDANIGRREIDAAHEQAKQAALADPLAATAGWDCFCEIEQLSGDELSECQNNPDDTAVAGLDGWCYVDATTAPPTGNPDIVASCPETEKRIIRFVGEGKGQPGATLFITCTGE